MRVMVIVRVKFDSRTRTASLKFPSGPSRSIASGKPTQLPSPVPTIPSGLGSHNCLGPFKKMHPVPVPTLQMEVQVASPMSGAVNILREYLLNSYPGQQDGHQPVHNLHIQRPSS